MSDTALIIFVKNPEKGKVKTRLASTMGDDMALKIYLALMEHTRNIASQLDTNRLLFYSQSIPPQDEWPNDQFQKFLQSSGDLGDRIQHAFKQAFQSYKKVVIIGSDCASLNQRIVKQAYDQLDKFPFVVGPAKDGGYYLLGMNQFAPTLFQDIEWSTDKVLKATLNKVAQLKKAVYLLPELSDIDYEADWAAYGWDLS